MRLIEGGIQGSQRSEEAILRKLITRITFTTDYLR